jgi:replicative DNA helicase
MSIEAQNSERAILSIICKNPDQFFALNDLLAEADFSNTGSSLIYTVVKELITKTQAKHIDAVLIGSEAERLGVENFVQYTLNGQLVDAILKMNVNPATLNKHLLDVKQASIKRALLTKCDDIKQDIEESKGSIADLRNMVETSILQTLQQIDTGLGNEDMVCLADDFEHVINQYADRAGQIGIDIGFPRWQADIGHIRNGAITGVFARSKVGKSQLSMYSAFKTAIEKKQPVLYLDTELQARQQQMRLCGIISGIPYHVIESGAWRSDKSMIERIKRAFAVIKNAPIYYKNIAGRSVNAVIPIIRKFVYKHLGGPVKGDVPTGLVVYDYIKLMDSSDLSKSLQEYQLIGLLLSHLHDCAAQLNIPIMALGQLNKQEDVGIDRIIHNVDSVTVLRPKKAEELENDGPARGTHMLEVKYCRNGPGHDFNEWVNLHFDKSCGGFKEDKRNSEVATAVNRVIESDSGKFGDTKEDF